MLNYLQTAETLIRRHVLRHLIWVCTVCQVPFYGSPDYNGLNNILFFRLHGYQFSVSQNIMCQDQMVSLKLIITIMYVVGTHKKHLTVALLMSTHKICFYGEKKKEKYYADIPSYLKLC